MKRFDSTDPEENMMNDQGEAQIRPLLGPTRVWYGGDHNPEQWPRHSWLRDIELMRAAGVNLVTVNIFSWSQLEPRPGEWHTDWLDEQLALLHRAGIAVDLATPTASPPPWFTIEHPDALGVDRSGQRYSHGSRNHFCPSAPAYRRAARELAERLARQYGSHPAVRLWHVGNEFGQECFCDHCALAFRDFLRDRHGDVEGLNAAWGTAFWSQQYGDLAEVLPPRHAPYRFNPAHLLDWQRFVNAQLLSAFTEQADVLRRHSGLPVTTNFMGLFRMVDPWSWADALDVVSDDHYVDPADPDAPARAALTHDLMRSVAAGPWLMMEQAMGAVNWRDHNVPKTAGQRRADVLRAVAPGADGVLSFQWRQSRSGAERFHSAMLPIQGPDTAHFREVCRIGAELERLAPVAGHTQQASVALVFDWDSWWAMADPGLPTRRLDPLAMLQDWRRALWRRGFVVDLVRARDVGTEHALVIAPCAHLLDDEGLAAIRGRISAGGATALGPFSSVVDADARLREGFFPAGLTDLLGARGEQWWPLAGDLPLVSQEFATGRAIDYAEVLTVDDAQVWARSAADHPELDAAVVRSPQRPFWYVGALLDGRGREALLGAILDQIGLRPELGALTDVPDGVDVAVRGPFTFVISHRDDRVELDLVGACTDLLHGATGRSISLAPRGSLVLERQER